MKNPLMKRLPRELIGDIGKYLVNFSVHDSYDRIRLRISRGR